MTAPRRLAVFDVDGTLVDSQNHIVAAMERAFDTVGLRIPPRAEVLSIVGLSLPEAIARLVPDQPPERRAAIVAAYKQGFGALRGESLSPLFPGALAALGALAGRPDTLLGVATGKSRRGLDHILAAHGLGQQFATLQVADDHPSKPHPSMLLAAMDETGVAARDAVMIGDTTFDIAMGKAAGMPVIGVGWGYHPRESLRAAGADAVIDDFADLAPLLARWWGTA